MNNFLFDFALFFGNYLTNQFIEFIVEKFTLAVN